MAESQALAQLHDIHLPTAISWWPLAPGWYLLILSSLIFIAVLYYVTRRRFRYGLAKRQALNLLEAYYQEYQSQANSQITSMKLSELLRRVALVYFPREQIANLQGEAWISFLNESSKSIDFDSLRDYLLKLPYQRVNEKDLEPLFKAVRSWIKQRGVPCSN